MVKKPLINIVAFLGTVSLILFGGFYYILQNVAVASDSPSLLLRPYFSYSNEEVQSLDSLNSDKVISKDEVDHWIQVVFDLAKKSHGDVDTTRLYAYFFTAQQDAAALSLQSKKKLSGNLTAVSTRTLCLLLPNECASIPVGEKPDTYSLKVADIVVEKITQRLKEEKQILESFPAPKIPPEWPQDRIYDSSNFGHAKPWLIDAGNQFRLKSPKEYDKEEIKIQKQELQNILSNITEEQLQLSEKWSNGPGTIATSGRWIALANDYMAKYNIPLERSLSIRSVLVMSIADATIAYFDSKYFHWKLRPTMQFKDIKANVKSAISPSYPSGHATLSMAAAIIMDYYFPENQAQWDKTAKEIGQSRLWGGVHFPIDDYDGLELGRKIGNWIVSKIKNKN